MPTDRAKGDPFGAKAFVDDLLVFSQPIGDDYSGEWIEDDSQACCSACAPVIGAPLALASRYTAASPAGRVTCASGGAPPVAHSHHLPAMAKATACGAHFRCCCSRRGWEFAQPTTWPTYHRRALTDSTGLNPAQTAS
jgi:hypothetical protein